MKLAWLFFLAALCSTGAHFWQLSRAVSLQKQIKKSELDLTLEELDDLPERMFAPPEERARIDRRIEQRQQDRKFKHRGLEIARNQAIELSGVFSITAPILLAFGFASIRPSSSALSKTDATVFISYNHRNLKEAQAIRDELVKRGVSVTLIDQLLNVTGDEELSAVLKETILQTRVMIVLLTPESMRSNWVGFERSLGDTKLQKLIYLCRGVSLSSALWRTHFLDHQSVGFRLIKSLKAKRRYLDLRSDHVFDLIEAHLSDLKEGKGALFSLKQIAWSYGSLDKLLLNALFNLCENHLYAPGASRFWKAPLAGCMVLQAMMLALPFYLAVWGASFLITLYS